MYVIRFCFLINLSSFSPSATSLYKDQERLRTSTLNQFSPLPGWAKGKKDQAAALLSCSVQRALVLKVWQGLKSPALFCQQRQKRKVKRASQPGRLSFGLSFDAGEDNLVQSCWGNNVATCVSDTRCHCSRPSACNHPPGAENWKYIKDSCATMRQKAHPITT